MIDELNGAKYFLDLRARYHQVRVKVSDIEFEFTVLAFGLTVLAFGLSNALATFQTLMNEVFQPYLRRFVLVFYDCIRVYSKSLEEHCQHLNENLKVLRKHHLYAKPNKCAFAQTQVDY